MKKILGAAAALALLSAPVLAQSPAAPNGAPNGANELQQDQVRPGVLGPGVDAVNKDGTVKPGGDIEAQTGGDGNMGLHTNAPYGQTNSGGSGINDDYGVGISSAPSASGSGSGGGPLQPAPQNMNGK
jgi:hypothetical protein